MRFTPTCVGTTHSRPASRLATAVHPHVRGDDFSGSWSLLASCGSPPRAWGRLLRLLVGLFLPRFTPTCVGTTIRSQPAPITRSVHPHVRGDDVKLRLGRGPLGGSPPRAWGRLLCVSCLQGQHRFTPTCVGTTDAEREMLRWAVHPHVRGDDLHLGVLGQRNLGSPPRAWGRRLASVAWSHTSRFTPTCVATTTSARSAAAVR